MKKTLFTGINIRWPISQLIVGGKKTVETRTYPLSEPLIGSELVIVETPGKLGKFKARMIGKIVFGKPFKYSSKTEFYCDFDRHCVDENSEWAWKDKPKWGWPILKITVFKKPITLKMRPGIVYSKNLTI